jgi:N-acetylglutamate synthase-like GNAT family acetyltransferase
MVTHSIAIERTEDYEVLIPMFIEQGLEFSEEEEVPTDIVACWKATDAEGRLLGGAVLARREGELICDGIATVPEVRGTGLGKRLLDGLIAEGIALGGRRLFLVARAPNFFRSQGFKTVSRAEAPNFFECFTCPQYQKTCFPEVMMARLQQADQE